jgi:hypothetical protein
VGQNNLSGIIFSFREDFLKIIANIQLIAGLVLSGFSIWLLLRPLDYPQNGIYFVVIELFLFSLVVFFCGLVLRTAYRFKEVSLWVFGFATIFVYIDFCTPFSRWYLG